MIGWKCHPSAQSHCLLAAGYWVGDSVEKKTDDRFMKYIQYLVEKEPRKSKTTLAVMVQVVLVTEKEH